MTAWRCANSSAMCRSCSAQRAYLYGPLIECMSRFFRLSNVIAVSPFAWSIIGSRFRATCAESNIARFRLWMRPR